jgi:MtrB/PioB family decaheme-associated outer membrane protein
MLKRGFAATRLLRTIGTATLAAVAAVVRAQDAGGVDTSTWKCEKCPFAEGKLTADIEAGAQYVDGTDAKFGDFTGLDEDGAYAVLAGTAGELHDSGTYWALSGDDLGLDGRSLSLEGGKAGRARLALEFEQLPHTIFDTTATPFTEVNAATLDLPADFVRAGTTQQMTTLDTSLRPADVGYDRDTLAVAGDVRLGEHWTTAVEYRRQERDGSTRGSGSFGFSALEFVQPVDDVTDGIALSLAYGGERLTGRIAYEASFYSNDNAALTWDNPYSGTETGRMQLAPDNEAQYLDASFVYRLAERTTLSANADVGRLEQDDDFLPYATDSTLAPEPLPRASLDGEVETTNLGLVLATSDAASLWNVLEGLRLRADVRYDERDNSTPQDAYAYVVTDTFPTGAVTNLPYGTERLNYGLSGTWNLRHLLAFLPDGQLLDVSGAWRHDDIERTYQDTSETSEDSGWGRVRYRPLSWLDFAVKLGSGKREVEDYQASSLLAAPQNPLMRKFYLADRERDFSDAEINLLPSDTLAFSVTGRYAKDEYFKSQLGLQSSRTTGATFFGSWTFGGESAANLSAHYGWDETESRQGGSVAFAAPDWSGVTEDTLNSGGITLRLPQVTDQLALGLDLFFANTEGDVTTSSSTSPAGALPQLRTRMYGGELTGEYRWSPALTLRTTLRYEHFDADDWQLDGVEPATVPTLLSLGADAYDYDVTLFELAFTYRFGAPPAETPESGESGESGE